MSVYDKELIIDGKAVRSPEQQVYKNMKDIESLQDTIKPEYKCTVELNTSATSVAKSNTNAGTDVKSGWLLDPKGKKFKITGGDDDNLLIDFYTSYQGPQGESGVSAIDDESTSATKVWSSQKVNNSLDKGIFTTMVEPTDLGGGLEYRLDYEDAPILTSGIHVRVNDLIIYIANKLLQTLPQAVMGDSSRRQLYGNQTIIAPAMKAKSVTLIVTYFLNRRKCIIFYFLCKNN